MDTTTDPKVLDFKDDARRSSQIQERSQVNTGSWKAMERRKWPCQSAVLRQAGDCLASGSFSNLTLALGKREEKATGLDDTGWSSRSLAGGRVLDDLDEHSRLCRCLS